jgi:hypothetical protein
MNCEARNWVALCNCTCRIALEGGPESSRDRFGADCPRHAHLTWIGRTHLHIARQLQHVRPGLDRRSASR